MLFRYPLSGLEVSQEKDFAREVRSIIWTSPSLKTSLKKEMLDQLAIDTRRRE